MKRQRLLIREAAKRDLDTHAAFIGEDSPQSALRFLEAAEESLKQLAEMPAMGTRYDPLDPRLAGLRRFRVRGFENYLIFYLPIEGGIEVVRVLHAARDIERIFES